MRTLLHSTLIIILSATLAAIPAMGMPANTASAPVGFVLQAERAHVGADITSGGATIYDGDRLETQEGGTMRARLGGSQMYLRPSTIADIHGLANGYSASLLRGTIIAASPEGQTFQLQANGATIRPVGSQATVAQVTWVNPNELLLTSNLGAIQVSLEGDIKTIEAGKSYRMEIQSEPSGPEGQGQGGGGPKRSGRKGAIYFWVTAAAVGAGIAVWRALVSPCAPLHSSHWFWSAERSRSVLSGAHAIAGWLLGRGGKTSRHSQRNRENRAEHSPHDRPTVAILGIRQQGAAGTDSYAC